jgi:hypothetical protein
VAVIQVVLGKSRAALGIRFTELFNRINIQYDLGVRNLQEELNAGIGYALDHNLVVVSVVVSNLPISSTFSFKTFDFISL